MNMSNEVRLLRGSFVSGTVSVACSLLGLFATGELVLPAFTPVAVHVVPGSFALFAFLLSHFMVGITVVSLYAALRSDHRSNSWAVVRAAVAAWFMIVALPANFS